MVTFKRLGVWSGGLTSKRHDETYYGYGNALYQDLSKVAQLTNNYDWTLPTRCHYYTIQLGQPKIAPEIVKCPLGSKITPN